MKEKILVTGIAGSGKSSICRQLGSIGYESYDIENIEGIFKMYRKDTGEVYEDYDNTNIGMIKNSEWRCNIEKLKQLLNKQKNDIAFYCGVASNMDEIFPFFSKVFLLQVTSSELHKRLSTREGTEDMGNTEEGRQAVLGWKDWWEEKMKEKGALVIPAGGRISEVAEKIIEYSKNEKSELIEKIK